MKTYIKLKSARTKNVNVQQRKIIDVDGDNHHLAKSLLNGKKIVGRS